MNFSEPFDDPGKHNNGRKKSRLLGNRNNPTRSKSYYTADRWDMSPIDAYFAPEKQKAMHAEIRSSCKQQTGRGSDTNLVSVPPLVIYGAHYETGCNA